MRTMTSACDSLAISSDEVARAPVATDATSATAVTAPAPAADTRARHNPLAGLEPLTAERAARIPENVARQTPLPVRVFDLENQRLVDVPKP